MSSTGKTSYYPSLNGLRAISIFMVMGYHLGIQDYYFKKILAIECLQPITFFLTDGQLGVNIFFVISGFLITSILAHEFQESGKINLKNFYIRRALRIFPAYYFLLFVYFFIQLSGYFQLTGASWLTSLTYTKYFNWGLDWFTCHFWSLSVEEHFYLLWPLIFAGGIQRVKWVAGIIFLTVPFLRVYFYFFPIEWINNHTIFYRLDAIAIGCLLAAHHQQILDKVKFHWSFILYSSVSILILLAWLKDEDFLSFFFIPFGATDGTLANILIALLVMYFVFGPKGFWYNFLNLKWLSYLGVLSYSIYLWQQFFLFRTDNWVTHFPQNLGFIFLAAIGSYHFIEKPFLKWKDKFSIRT